MRTTILAISMFLFLPSAAQARHSFGKLMGTVILPDGRPAAGAEVVVERSDGSHPVATHADSAGRFSFEYMRHGLYDVRASRGHFASAWKHNLVVRRGKITSVALRLEPLAPAQKIPASVRKP